MRGSFSSKTYVCIYIGYFRMVWILIMMNALDKNQERSRKERAERDAQRALEREKARAQKEKEKERQKIAKEKKAEEDQI